MNFLTKIVEVSLFDGFQVEVFIKYSAFLLITALLSAMALFLIAATNAVKKLLMLGLVSITVVFYWAVVAGEFYYVYLGYLVAFTGAVLMLFLSVVLMLPAVTERASNKKIKIEPFVFFVALVFAVLSDEEMKKKEEGKKERVKQIRAYYAKLDAELLRRQRLEKFQESLGPIALIYQLPILFVLYSYFYTVLIGKLLKQVICTWYNFLTIVFPIKKIIRWGKKYGYLEAVRYYFTRLRSLIKAYQSGTELDLLLSNSWNNSKQPEILNYINSIGHLLVVDEKNVGPIRALVSSLGRWAFYLMAQEDNILNTAERVGKRDLCIMTFYRFVVSGRLLQAVKQFIAKFVILAVPVIICLNIFVSALATTGLKISGTTLSGVTKLTGLSSSESGLVEIFTFIYQSEPSLLILTALVLLVAIIGAAVFFMRAGRVEVGESEPGSTMKAKENDLRV